MVALASCNAQDGIGEAAVRLCAMVMGLGIAVVSVSRWPVLSGIALLFEFGVEL